MTGAPIKTFHPNPAAAAAYDTLHALYTRLHDSFGLPGHSENLADVMKKLLTLRDQSRK
jgi:hypothetical protein